MFQPQNIVMMGDFPNCEIKLCDFEISRVILEGTDIREILGTPDYVGMYPAIGQAVPRLDPSWLPSWLPKWLPRAH